MNNPVKKGGKLEQALQKTSQCTGKDVPSFRGKVGMFQVYGIGTPHLGEG